MALVDLSLAISAVKQGPGVDDDMIQLSLDGATQSALDYLNRQVFETDNAMAAAVAAGTAGDNPMVLNGAIKAAIVKLTVEMYTNRDNSAPGTISELPFNARTLLRPHRIIPGV